MIKGLKLIAYVLVFIGLVRLMTSLQSNEFAQGTKASVADLAKQESNYFQNMREQMVETQITARGITDQKVLKAMSSVPRHEFVPSNLAALAYEDSPLPIGEGQTISQPYIVAYMTEQLGLKGTERVLEIGTGSGYQAAVLASIVQQVYSVEFIEALAKRAGLDLQRQGFKNVQVKHGDGYFGWPEEAPFDAIMVTAAPSELPQQLLEQLKTGAKLIAPVGGDWQELVLFTKHEDGSITEKKLLPVRFVPMVGEVQNK